MKKIFSGLVTALTLTLLTLTISCSMDQGNQGDSKNVSNDTGISTLDVSKNVVITRDPLNTRLSTVDDFNGSFSIFSGSLDTETFTYPPANGTNEAAGPKIALIINRELYSTIENGINIYISDLQNEGYTVITHIVNNNGNVRELKALLKTDYINEGIEGAFLVGNLPVAWYEMDDFFNQFNNFPMDYYLMDMDGLWLDTDNNGKFDTHSGEYKADIYVARLLADTLQYGSPRETALINNYFKKNHDYRTGALRLEDKAFCIVNEDWKYSGFEKEFKAAYADQTLVMLPEESVTADAYRNAVKKQSNNRYESLLICAHSGPTTSYFYNSQTRFRSTEIADLGIQVNFYNLFNCSGARFTENDNLAVWYTMQTEYGLNTVGSTKTGSMLNFTYYYQAMNEGKSLGASFLQWYKDAVTLSASDQRWYNGMVMIGDPTLKISRFMDSSNNDTEAPTAPQNLQVLTNSNNVALSCSESTDNVGVTGYNFYCNDEIVYVSYGTTAYTTLAGSGTYKFVVTAFDAAGNESARSNEVTVTITGSKYVTVTAPFSFDGAGEYFWKTTNVPDHINSWDADLVEINGVDLTNLWIFGDSLPAKQDGYYYIHFKGSLGWSHFEAK